MSFTKQNYIPGDVLTADQMNAIQDAIVRNEGNIDSHIENQENPHGVTAEQVGARPNTWMPTASQVGAPFRYLLWENDEPDAPFPAQTINVNWTNKANNKMYDGFEVVFITDSRSMQDPSYGVEIGTTGFIPHMSDWDARVVQQMAVPRGANSYRFVEIYEGAEEFKFGDAYSTTTPNSKDNSYIIPMYIYGIGGVKY